jgi:multidrug efflux pump subunit AcrA (membrane-fusion protein)
MKYLIRTLGILAIIVALFILVGEHLVGSSGNAFVNTRLAMVRTPIDGQVEMAPLAIGARVTAGQSIATVNARATQTDRTLEYARELAIASAERAALADVASEIAGFDHEYEFARLQAREEVLQSLLSDQQAAQSRDVSANITSPVHGIVWSIAEGNASQVGAGATIASIARCDAAFIHANVDERLYNRLAIGDNAQYRAGTGQIMDATVSLLAGVGPRTLIETLAIEPGASRIEGYTVLLNASAVQGTSCPLGETGRVIFSRGPLAVLGDWFRAAGF